MNREKHGARGRKLVALFTLTVFLLGLMVQPALALDFGVYTAPANTYYKNPETGVIEDGGSRDEELGEGMCRSAVGETALIEVDANGNVYVTMRMLLYSNLSKIKFYVQDKPGGSYSQVKASITAEDSSNDSADFRMKMPRAGANVKTTMYVAPMGRDVTFFWNVSAGAAKSGSGDFAVNINLNAKPKAEEPKQEVAKQEEVKQEVKPAVSEPAKTETGTAVKTETKTEVKTEAKTESKTDTKTEQVDNSKTEAAANEKDTDTEGSKTSEQPENSDVTEENETVNEDETVSDEPVIENEEENNDDAAAAVEESEEAPAEEESSLPVVPIVCVLAVVAVGAVVIMRKK